MSNLSIKDILETEFKSIESGGKSKKKEKKIKNCLGPQRHGLKKARLLLKKQRLEQCQPRNKLYMNRIEFESKDERDEEEKVEAEIERLIKFSEHSGSRIAGSVTVVQHNHKTKRAYTPKCRRISDKSEGKKKPKQNNSNSLFTDQDFETFAKEYFGNSEPINQTTLDNKRKTDEKAEYS